MCSARIWWDVQNLLDQAKCLQDHKVNEMKKVEQCDQEIKEYEEARTCQLEQERLEKERMRAETRFQAAPDLLSNVNGLVNKGSLMVACWGF